MNPVAQKIELLVEQAWRLKNDDDYRSWLRRVVAYLNAAVGSEMSKSIVALGGNSAYSAWEEYRDVQASYLEGQLARMVQLDIEQDRMIEQAVAQVPKPKPNNNTVFLVHGHDVSAKEATARFLEKLKLKVVILHEQASENRTVIEKFEAYSDVGYAVVLLTPDDIGASAVSAASMDQLNGRARQNVILELGYFTGKLGRRHVCGLFKPGVEVPSDLHGVLFIELDSQGGWKTKIAQELVSAGMKIDLQGLLHS